MVMRDEVAARWQKHHAKELEQIALYAQRAGQRSQQYPDRPDWVGITLLPGGECCKFVRECHEEAADMLAYSWPFHAATAADTEYKLQEEGREWNLWVPGSIICFRDGSEGHIAILVANDMVAENTISGRGDPSRPGTKLTPLSVVLAAHGGISRRYYGGTLRPSVA